MNDNVFVFHDKVTESFCSFIVQKYGTSLNSSDVLGEQIPGYRVADVTWITDTEDRIISNYEEMIEHTIGIPRRYFEHPHIVKYNVGGEYKKHNDFFHPDTDYYNECMRHGGQRTHTIILYLNDNFQGGETEFVDLGFKVTPKTGSMCVFKNTDENGNLLHNTLHAGLPVTEGTKYIMVTWVRELPFRNSLMLLK